MSLNSVPWPVLMLGVLTALMAFMALIAFLLYRLAKAAISKTDARDVPKVLAEIAGLVKCFTRPLSQTLAPLQGVLGLPPSTPGAAAAAQTSQQDVGATEAAQ